jgi:abortive infection bacteriophage resistance protein
MATELPRQLKPHISVEEQLQVLINRGLIVEDKVFALKQIERLGYYRLSGYFYPLRKTKPYGEKGRQDTFQEGTTFELVNQIAEFDKKLRMLVLPALETIEIAIRVAIAHHLGKLDPNAHNNTSLLDGKFYKPKANGAPSDYDSWKKRFEDACNKSKEEFVEHHKALYGGEMPIWVAVELWDFGLLSRFVSGLQQRDKNALAQKYGLGDGRTLESWVRLFNFIRNVAAHHSRLWNRSLPTTPVLPPVERCRWLEVLHKNPRALTKTFGAFMCLQLMLKSIDPASQWHQSFVKHIHSFPKSDLISIESMGFVKDWEKLPIWND